MTRTKIFDTDQALEKARDIFWTKGYNATSMSDLVNGLGISRSSMYNAFGDKEALFYASLEGYQKENSTALIELFKHSKSPLAAIRNLFTLTINDSVADKQNKGCFIVNAAVELAPHDDKVKNIACTNTQIIERALAHQLEIGQEMGEVNRKYTAKQQSKFLFNAITGMRVAAKNGMDKKSLSDIAALTLAAISI